MRYFPVFLFAALVLFGCAASHYGEKHAAIRIFNAIDATTFWGSNHEGGAFLITTK